MTLAIPPWPGPNFYPRPPLQSPFNRARDVSILQQTPGPALEVARTATDFNLADQRRNIRGLRPGVFLQTQAAKPNHNSFSRAFAQDYYGDENMWTWVKVETRRYFFSVNDGHQSHPRRIVYRQLENIANLGLALTGDNTERRRELIFLMADLYDVQIIWVHGKDDRGRNICDGRSASGAFAEVRGSNHCRQIVLFTPERYGNSILQWSLLTPVNPQGDVSRSDQCQ